MRNAVNANRLDLHPVDAQRSATQRVSRTHTAQRQREDSDALGLEDSGFVDIEQRQLP
jgi:hypothetical protein